MVGIQLFREKPRKTSRLRELFNMGEPSGAGLPQDLVLPGGKGRKQIPINRRAPNVGPTRLQTRVIFPKPGSFWSNYKNSLLWKGVKVSPQVAFRAWISQKGNERYSQLFRTPATPQKPGQKQKPVWNRVV
ncbi:MAG: hypothetical protein V1817_01805 [Candidatus Micrarchaeota archaeon]